MELFQTQQNREHQPLAERLRPQRVEDIWGQDQILGKSSQLGELIRQDQVPSLILWGPPGTGKTTLAQAIANVTQKEFISLNAIDTGAKALREEGEAAKNRRALYGKGTVVFLDEIHRLNKAQQDVLLPFVEKGDFTLIGATTENPSFHVNSALLSRSRLVVFKRLSEDVLEKIFWKGLTAGASTPSKPTEVSSATEIPNPGEVHSHQIPGISAEVVATVISMADGDARRLLNSVEQIRHFLQMNPDAKVTAENLIGILGTSVIYHDRKGDSHYDTISAFIKSIRGSDPDAGLYYLARMLEAGEDPLFLARRLVILASEDVGNGDPRALQIAVAGMQAVELVGLPEAAINLAQVVTYLACAPKSNRSYTGLRKAQDEVRRSGNLPIPLSVRNAPTQMMKDLGYGREYNYAHEGAKGWLEQNFLPEALEGKKFYEPSERGFEKQIKAYLEWLKSDRSTKK